MVRFHEVAQLQVEIQRMRRLQVGRLVIAAPVAAAETWQRLSLLVDQAYCVMVHEDLQGISQFYDEFPQVEDAEVVQLLSSTQGF